MPKLGSYVPRTVRAAPRHGQIPDGLLLPQRKVFDRIKQISAIGLIGQIGIVLVQIANLNPEVFAGSPRLGSFAEPVRLRHITGQQMSKPAHRLFRVGDVRCRIRFCSFAVTESIPGQNLLHSPIEKGGPASITKDSMLILGKALRLGDVSRYRRLQASPRQNARSPLLHQSVGCLRPRIDRAHGNVLCFEPHGFSCRDACRRFAACRIDRSFPLPGRSPGTASRGLNPGRVNRNCFARFHPRTRRDAPSQTGAREFLVGFLRRALVGIASGVVLEEANDWRSAGSMYGRSF